MALPVVAILGAGDLGTACALRLFRSGFKVIIVNQMISQNIHYSRNFLGAIYSGAKKINGVQVRTSADLFQREEMSFENFENSFLPFLLNNNEIPLLTEDEIASLSTIKIEYLIVTDEDLFAFSMNNGIIGDDTKVIIFDSLEIKKGNYIIRHDGLVNYPFLKDDFEVTKTDKITIEPKLDYIKAPIEGVFISQKDINSILHLKEEIGKIGDISILSPYGGKLTGLINSGAIVTAGTDLAEISPLRENRNDGKIIPEKQTLLAGGVLEALLFDLNLRNINISL